MAQMTHVEFAAKHAEAEKHGMLGYLMLSDQLGYLFGDMLWHQEIDIRDDGITIKGECGVPGTGCDANHDLWISYSEISRVEVKVIGH